MAMLNNQRVVLQEIHFLYILYVNVIFKNINVAIISVAISIVTHNNVAYNRGYNLLRKCGMSRPP